MISRIGGWLGLSLLRLGWYIYIHTDRCLVSLDVWDLCVERKHIKYRIEIDREWKKEQRKAKLEKQIKKHEEEIRRLQYEIDFKLR